jgi:hypothetical protein
VADGTWEGGLIDDGELERVRAHVAKLVSVGGVTTMRVVEVAGISHHALDGIRVGHPKRMTRVVASALLGVTTRACLALITRDTTPVDITGSRRRLRALAVDGWSTERISALTGMALSLVRRHRNGRECREITLGNHERYRLFYEKVQAQADPSGGSAGARDAATAAGWLGPERWADEDIDNPSAEPLPPPPEDSDDWVAVSNLVDGALRDPRPGKAAGYPRPVQREIARQAIKRLGWSYERVAELLGKSTNAVDYMLHGRNDRPWTRKVKDV